MKRKCLEDSTWGKVKNLQNCYSTEISALHDNSKWLMNYYYGNDFDFDFNPIYIDFNHNFIDFREISSSDLLNVNFISKELNSLTNSSQPLAPRDLNFANNILDTIIR